MMSNISDSDIISQSDYTTISSTSLLEHIKQHFINKWKMLFLSFVTIFFIFWGFIRVIVYIFDVDLSKVRVLIVLIIISLIFAFIKTIYSYINTVPIGLEQYSKDIQKIGHFKKMYWEFKLAYSLLAQNIQRTDQKFDEILNDLIFVKTKKLTIEEYFVWLDGRPSNIINMIKVANNLIVVELFNCTVNKEGEGVNIQKLVQVVSLIQRLYEDAYNFQIEGKQFIVPIIFKNVHSIQSEWVKIIRNAIHQLIEKLKEISLRNKKSEGAIIAHIEFEQPKRLEEYKNELAQIKEKLHELIADQYN